MIFHNLGRRLACAAASFGYALAAFAANYTWSGGTTGDWNVSANWGGSGFPNDYGDSAAIDSPAAVGLAGMSYKLAWLKTSKDGVSVAGGELVFSAGSITNAASGGKLTLSNVKLVNLYTGTDYKQHSICPGADNVSIVFDGDNSVDGFLLRTSKTGTTFKFSGGSTTFAHGGFSFGSTAYTLTMAADDATFSIDSGFSPSWNVNFTAAPGSHVKSGAAIFEFGGDISFSGSVTFNVDLANAKLGTYKLLSTTGDKIENIDTLIKNVTVTGNSRAEYEVSKSKDGKSILVRYGEPKMAVGLWVGAPVESPAAMAASVGTALEFQDSAGSQFDSNRPDAGYASQSSVYWLSTGLESDATILSGSGKSAYATTTRAPAAKAEVTAAGHDDRFLKLGGSAELYRTIMPRVKATRDEFEPAALGEGIVADFVAQMPASEDEPEMALENAITLWVNEKSRLVVTAGRFCDGLRHSETTNYVTDTEVAGDKWYRFTIVALGDITSGGMVPGYVVYVDGVRVTIASGEPSIFEDESVIASLTGVARVLASGSDGKCALFPSRHAAATDKAVELAALRFAGAGYVDDVSIAPAQCISSDYAFANNPRVMTLEFTSGVKEFTYLDGGVTKRHSAGGKPGSIVFALSDDATGVEVTSVVYEDDWRKGTWTASGGASVASGGFAFAKSASQPVGKIVAERSAVGVGAGGDYTSFAEAFKASNSVKLQSDVDLAVATADDGVVRIPSGGDYVINLNGHRLVGKPGEGQVVYNAGSNLTIIDSSPSSGAGRVTPASADQAAVRNFSNARTASKLTIKGGVYDGLVENVGTNFTCVIAYSSDGLASFTNVTGEAEFYLADYVEKGYCYTLFENGYWSGASSYSISYFDYDGNAIADARMPETYIRQFSADTPDSTSLPTAVWPYRIFRGWWDRTFTVEYKTVGDIKNSSTPLADISLYAKWESAVAGSEIDKICVWTGEGEDDEVARSENWFESQMPFGVSGGTAVFPSNGAPWRVSNQGEKEFDGKVALDGDVEIASSSTLDMSRCTVAGGYGGRFVGGGTLKWCGRIPGVAPHNASGDLSTVLGEGWRGTVRVCGAMNVDLNRLDTWGNANSKVVFCGVSGGVLDPVSREMPYTLELANGQTLTECGNEFAWNCRFGFTGSTLRFARLVGDGNLYNDTIKPSLQVFKFADVSEYTGNVVAENFRFVVGDENPADDNRGVVKFSTGATVRVGNWVLNNAVFGRSVNFIGNAGVVLYYTDDVGPDITGHFIAVTLNGAAAALVKDESAKTISVVPSARAAALRLAGATVSAASLAETEPTVEISVDAGKTETRYLAFENGARVVKTGAGTLRIDCDNSGFSSGITVREGTLEIVSENALGTGTAEVLAGATLNLNGRSLACPLSVAGTIRNDSEREVTLASLSLAGDATMAIAADVAVAAASFNGFTLAKTLSGALVLDGATVEGEGALNVIAGRLDCRGSVSLGGQSELSLAISSGATLGLADSCSLEVKGGFTCEGAVSGSGELVLSGTVTVPGKSIYAENIRLAAGAEVVFGESGMLVATKSLAVEPSVALDVTRVATGSSSRRLDVVRSPNSLALGSFSVVGHEELMLVSGYESESKSYAEDPDTGEVIELVSPAYHRLTLVSATIDVAEGETAALSMPVASAGAVVKTGAGTLVVTGDASGFGGGFDVREGTLRLGDSAKSLGVGTTAVAGGATLDLNGFAPGGSLALAEGALVTSAGEASGVMSFALEGDASVSGEITLADGSYLALGGHTLAKVGEGTLSLGAISTDETGTLAVSSGAIANESAENAFTGTSLAALSGGELRLDAALAVSNLTLSGGSVTGGALTLSGAIELESSSSVANLANLPSSRIVFASGAVLAITGDWSLPETGHAVLDVADGWSGEPVKLVAAACAVDLDRLDTAGADATLYRDGDAIFAKAYNTVSAKAVFFSGSVRAGVNFVATEPVQVLVYDYELAGRTDLEYALVTVAARDTEGNLVATAADYAPIETPRVVSIALEGLVPGRHYTLSAEATVEGQSVVCARAENEVEVVTARPSGLGWINENAATFTNAALSSGTWLNTNGVASVVGEGASARIEFATPSDQPAVFAPSAPMGAKNVDVFEVELAATFDVAADLPAWAGDAVGALTLTTDSSGESVLAVGTASGWVKVSRSVFAPEAGVEYSFAVVVEKSAGRITYFTGARGSRQLVGTFACGDKTRVTSVDFVGPGSVESLTGVYYDANLAEVTGGEEYASVWDAVRASGGENVEPLWHSVCHVSTNESPVVKGYFTIANPLGYSFDVTADDGVEVYGEEIAPQTNRYFYANTRSWLDYADEKSVVREGNVWTVLDGRGLAYLAKLSRSAGLSSGITIRLGAPIDLSRHVWTPIKGLVDFVFDGCGYEIKGLNNGNCEYAPAYTNALGCYKFGLFENDSLFSSKFMNVTFADVAIEDPRFYAAGALVGAVGAGRIEISNVVVRSGAVTGCGCVAGVVGVASLSSGSLVIADCRNAASVTVLSSGEVATAAGVCAQVDSAAELDESAVIVITGCMNSGAITAEPTDDGEAAAAVAGVAVIGYGRFASVDVSRNTNTGAISSRVSRDGDAGGNVAEIVCAVSDEIVLDNVDCSLNAGVSGAQALDIVGSDDRLLVSMPLCNFASRIATYDYESGDYAFFCEANDSDVAIVDAISHKPLMSHARYEDDVPNVAGQIRDVIARTAAGGSVSLAFFAESHTVSIWSPIVADRDLTIDLGGCTVYAETQEYAFLNTNATATVTLKNGTICACSGKWKGGDGSFNLVGVTCQTRDNLVEVGGSYWTAASLPSVARAGMSIVIPSESDVDVDGRDVLCEGEVVASFAGYYTVTKTESAGGAMVALALNEDALPGGDECSPALSLDGQTFSFTVAGGEKSLYYGLESRSSLDETWSPVASWVRPDEDGSVTLDAPAASATGFYRLVVTDAP